MVEELAREYQQELAAAGTRIDLEELTCQVGNEFARQLCEREWGKRAERASVAAELTNFVSCTCASDAGASYRMRSHALCVGTRTLQTSWIEYAQD
jgi:hypothetical protein